MQSRLTTTTSAFIPAGQVILHRDFEKKNLHGARTVKSAVRHDLVRATCAPRRHHPPSRLESSASSQAPNHRTRTSRRAETSIQSKPTPRDGTRGRLLALAPPGRRVPTPSRHPLGFCLPTPHPRRVQSQAVATHPPRTPGLSSLCL